MKIQGRNIPDELWRNLRNSQQSSVKVVFKYLKANAVGKSSLVFLPTGAGKTSIIATVAHFSKQKKVLVLCHRKAVCEQLVRELGGGFFDKLEIEQKFKLKDVSNSFDFDKNTEIVVSTFQKLLTFDDEQLAAFEKSFDMLMVEWSDIASRVYDIFDIALPAGIISSAQFKVSVEKFLNSKDKEYGTPNNWSSIFYSGLLGDVQRMEVLKNRINEWRS